MRCSVALAGWLLLSFGLTACQTDPPQFQPAQQAEVSEQARVELTEVVQAATGSTNLVLAKEPFKTSYILVVQPGAGHAPNARLATGRTVEKPHTFHLQTDGIQCALWHVNANKLYALQETRCSNSAEFR